MDNVELWRRQDTSSAAETSAPLETSEAPTSTSESSTAPSTTSIPESTTPVPPTSTTPTNTPTSNSPVQSATLPTVSATPTPTPTPTDPAESSAVVSQSSVSNASTRSAVSSLSNAGSSPVGTAIYTSFITTNGAGQSIVTISITSTYAVPTTAPAKSSTNTGAIVGGVVGGVGGLLLLIAVLWFIRRRTKKDQFEENMFAPDRNVDRGELDLAGDDVDDPEAMARPYHLPPSPTRNEMSTAAGSQPLSMHSALSTGRPLSGNYDEAAGMPRPTSGASYYAQPGGGVTMPIPMRMSLDHVAYTQSRTNSTVDHHNPPSEALSDTSSSARLMKEREARRMHVSNVDNGGVVVHSDGGRVNEEDEGPQEIPPTYDSIGGPSGPSGSR